jgi:iron uptake system component EfeO
MLRRLSPVVFSLALFACSSSDPDGDPAGGAAPTGPALTDAQYREQAVDGMHDALLTDVQAMRAAIADLQKAAPADHAWDAQKDAESIAAMRAAWVRARTAYERVEGALAPLFPDIDNAIDARYDDFMTQLAATGGDADLFDGKGVTGMHALERIVYADVIPPRVIAFEKSLPGYVPAAFPSSAAEAASFKDALCTRLLSDVDMLEAQWTPANIDAAIAFQGLVMLVQEQREKVQKAASNEEESRYSQRTMADLRDNLEGSRKVYAMFRPWLLSKPEGAAIDAKIQAGFDALGAAYDAVKGAAIPEPPATWSAESPSAADLATPFGRLYTAVRAAVDPADAASTAAQLDAAAGLLGLADLSGGQ